MYYLRDKSKYAKPGEPIYPYNFDHGEVWLCRNEAGVTFPVHKNRLTLERPEEIEPLPKERAKPERRRPLTQAEKLQLEYLNSIGK